MDSDIFSKISAVLENPEMSKEVKNLASGLMGENKESKNEEFNPEKLKSLMSGMNANNKNVTLLNAIAPYMRKERATKINSAIKAVQMLTILSSLK